MTALATLVSALTLTAAVAAEIGRRLTVTRSVVQNPSRPLASPRTLYPVVDPERCIESGACLAACPEGEILAIEHGIPVLTHPDKCVGHGVCADECPVAAIRLVLGSRERAVLLPELRGCFESSRPGVHVVGELAGAPLIEQAVRQGVALGEHLAHRMRVARRRGAVVIVGAGPAGLATAFALSQAGVPYRVLERSAALSTIHSYPAGKVVTTRPLRLPGAGLLARGRISREMLLARCVQALEEGGIQVQEHVDVLGVAGRDGAFDVRTSSGSMPASKVVLAIGRSGSPRSLGVSGEHLPKVVHQLTDPARYAGMRTLVVGGGDTALEGAVALAHSGAEVVICHRGAAFTRCRDGSRRALEALVATGGARALLGTSVTRIESATVHLRTPGGDLVLPNDLVVLAIGNELPVRLLERSGIALREYRGDTAERPGVQGARTGLASSRAALALAVALSPSALLFWLQEHWDYYRLPWIVRDRAPLHASLRPSSAFGTALGIVSTALMIGTFAYVARKRARRLVGFGGIRAWLDVHIAAGALCLVAVAVHAGFSARHALGAMTYVALAALAATGAVGRFTKGNVRSTSFSCQRASHFSVRNVALASWRTIHLVLAAFTAVVVAAHLLVAILFGYVFR